MLFLWLLGLLLVGCIFFAISKMLVIGFTITGLFIMGIIAFVSFCTGKTYSIDPSKVFAFIILAFGGVGALFLMLCSVGLVFGGMF